jgi:ADP-ribose pyrophosphatase YjhB (NUDIX family)
MIDRDRRCRHDSIGQQVSVASSGSGHGDRNGHTMPAVVSPESHTSSITCCSHCGQRVSQQIPEGDNRLRAVCSGCGSIHYENPRIVVGCVPSAGDLVLLCRRAIEPRKGYWTMPAGFMELGETLGDAARRETWEEALARVELGQLYAVVDVVQAGQVHMFFTGTLLNTDFGPGTESLETRLFRLEDIPWDQLAFPSVHVALEQYVENRRAGHQQLRFSAVPRLGFRQQNH